MEPGSPNGSFLYVKILGETDDGPALVGSRMPRGGAPLTQALIADSVEENERDAAFSAFFLIGFISVPIWGITTGVMMEFFGFSVAFSVIAFTYIIGMFLMSFVQEKPRVPA